jgi:hypothetical protein
LLRNWPPRRSSVPTQYGSSRVGTEMPVHRTQDRGRRLQGKRCESDGRKKETDSKRTGCSIRLGRRHEARCVADSRADQRDVAVLCQSHPAANTTYINGSNETTDNAGSRSGALESSSRYWAKKITNGVITRTIPAWTPPAIRPAWNSRSRPQILNWERHFWPFDRAERAAPARS